VPARAVVRRERQLDARDRPARVADPAQQRLDLPAERRPELGRRAAEVELAGHALHPGGLVVDRDPPQAVVERRDRDRRVRDQRVHPREQLLALPLEPLQVGDVDVDADDRADLPVPVQQRRDVRVDRAGHAVPPDHVVLAVPHDGPGAGSGRASAGPRTRSARR
jgi:hypothetical protein